ncbi:fibrous sheath CABYR-binding protein-like isoform X3 [Photinus pyralis]|uniref:fibrous sheath CABYR-binding protein-like isoform X3 n=2 Tax=Photinus pyralis TaxID=7054 RepID=UPI0012673299|nr:fibrous sheath CABYR-binding protein-like isoform X3 [Photinus pyralis]
MDVTDTLPETIMENPESIGDPGETPEDVQTTSNENTTEPKADFITSLLEDSFNEQCASADNMLIGECDEPASGLELSHLVEQPKSTDFFSIDIQSPEESEPLKENMDVDEEIDTAKEKDIEVSIGTTRKEVTAEGDVEQPSQEITRLPDEITASEPEEVPVTTENVPQPSTDKPNVSELENPPPEPVHADDNIQQPTEIILTVDERETTELDKPPQEITAVTEAVTVTDQETNVQQLPTEIILSDDDETDVSEVEKPSQEITDVADKEANLQQVPTEIILTDDEADPSELEPHPPEIAAITIEDDDDHTRSDIVFPNEEAMGTDNETEKDESGDKETPNADTLMTIPEIISCVSESGTNVVDSVTSEDIPTSRKEGETGTEGMEVQESDTPNVPAESEKNSEVTKDSVSDADNVLGDSLNKESNNADASDGQSAPMETDTVSDDVVEKSVTTGNVDTEEVDDSDPVFVSTDSEKTSSTEKTAAGEKTA